MLKSKETIEFGDFQTPIELAKEILSILNTRDYQTIIKPTCGLGAFLIACIDMDMEVGIQAKKLIGWEINPEYVTQANQFLRSKTKRAYNLVTERDFFKIDRLEVLDIYINNLFYLLEIHHGLPIQNLANCSVKIFPESRTSKT